MSALTKEERATWRQVSREYEKRYNIRWLDSIFGDGKYREGYLAGMTVSEGGWYGDRPWLTKALALRAEHRWYERDRAQAPKDDEDWVPHQCGGCKFFGALNADWGICWNETSPLDGHVVFEHVGCAAHSYLKEARP